MIERRVRACHLRQAHADACILATMRVGSIVAAALAVAGCIPIRFSGYEPTGAGTAEASYCVAGIRDTLRIQAPHGVAVYLRADVVTLKRDADRRERIMELRLDMAVPLGITVRLTDPLLRLESPEWERPRELEIAEITSGGPRWFGPTELLTGLTERPDSLFSFAVKLPALGAYSQSGIAAPTRFTLHVPPLEINGKAFDLQPVRFEMYRRWSVYTCVQ